MPSSNDPFGATFAGKLAAPTPNAGMAIVPKYMASASLSANVNNFRNFLPFVENTVRADDASVDRGVISPRPEQEPTYYRLEGSARLLVVYWCE